MSKTDLPHELAMMIPIIDAMAVGFGEKYTEFILHDFRHPEESLVYIRGNITGRSVGAPLTDYLLNIYKNKGDDAEDILGLITYTNQGLVIKSSSIFIRNKQGKIIGSVGININISAFRMFSDFINEVFPLQSADKPHEEVNFAENMKDILDDLINKSMLTFVGDAKFLSREERMRLVRDLEKKGAFLIKGAVSKVAKRLNVSKYTIYNYLDEIRD